MIYNIWRYCIDIIFIINHNHSIVTTFIINDNLVTLIPTLDIGVKDNNHSPIFSSLELCQGISNYTQLVVSNWYAVFCSWLILKISLMVDSMIVVYLKLDTKLQFTHACNTNLKMKLRSNIILVNEITIQKKM